MCSFSAAENTLVTTYRIPVWIKLGHRLKIRVELNKLTRLKCVILFWKEDDFTSISRQLLSDSTIVCSSLTFLPFRLEVEPVVVWMKHKTHVWTPVELKWPHQSVSVELLQMSAATYLCGRSAWLHSFRIALFSPNERTHTDADKTERQRLV